MPSFLDSFFIKLSIIISIIGFYVNNFINTNPGLKSDIVVKYFYG